jgi:mannose-1-phosphate guanylyltransferase
MKILIFAGGVGKRMWPLSRKSSPKQFIKMFDGKSTLELAVNRVKSFGYENIHISTLEEYVPLTKRYLPTIPSKNIVGEPELRNLAPAVGYNLIRVRAQGYEGPIAILWADHLIKNEDSFTKMLEDAEKVSIHNPNKIIFVGKKPRFANNNLGWIHFGKEIDENVFEYKDWKYKPSVEECDKIFKSKEWLWNTGYFVMDINFGVHLFEKYQPEMYKSLLKIEKSIGTDKEKETVKKTYPILERINYDNAIAMKVKPNEALVLKTNIEWSDPGTLYALKEALASKKKENLIMGNIVEKDTKDSLVINEEKSKLMVTLGVKGTAIINTKDVILVVPKESVKEISELLKEFEENEKLSKYL